MSCGRHSNMYHHMWLNNSNAPNHCGIKETGSKTAFRRSSFHQCKAASNGNLVHFCTGCNCDSHASRKRRNKMMWSKQ